MKEAKAIVQKLSNSWWTTCFCPRDTVKIQAATHVDNIASQKDLERTGFTRGMDSCERRCQFGESGLTVTYTAFSGKNGKNQKY